MKYRATKVRHRARKVSTGPQRAFPLLLGGAPAEVAAVPSGLSRLVSDGFEVEALDLVNVRVPGEVLAAVADNACGDHDMLLTPAEARHLAESLSRALVALDVEADWRGESL